MFLPICQLYFPRDKDFYPLYYKSVGDFITSFLFLCILSIKFGTLAKTETSPLKIMITLARENQSVRMAHSSCYSTFMVDSAGMTQLVISGFNIRTENPCFSLECDMSSAMQAWLPEVWKVSYRLNKYYIYKYIYIYSHICTYNVHIKNVHTFYAVRNTEINV